MSFELEPAKKIIGEHIYLEHPTPSFKLATEMFNVVDKNREHILPWLPWADVTITKTPENSYGFMTGAVSKWKNKTNFEYLIHLKETGEIIGGLGVSRSDMIRPHKIEIGYWLSQDFCRRGYIKEAVRLAEKEFFSNEHIVRIVIRNDVENIASANTAKSLGYKLEGIAVKEQWNTYLKKHRDMNHWAKVRE